MKYLSIIKYVLLILSAILVVLGFTGATEVDTILIWTYVMFLLTVVLALVMPLFGILQNPKSAGRSLIGLGAIIVIFIVSYALASDTPIKMASGDMITDSSELIFGDTALYATYIMFGAVLVSIFGTELYKSFKN